LSEPNGSTVDEAITETPIEDLPALDVAGNVESGESEPDVSTESTGITTTVEDCEMLYGVVMETAHGIIGTRGGKGHRELPDERRKAQGKLLHSICEKYGIEIPTELEVVIFGGSMIADWQYMTVKAENDDV